MLAETDLNNKKETLKLELPYQSIGYEQDELTQKELHIFINEFNNMLFQLSANIKLENLEGLSIANGETSYDYALSILDRGFESGETLTRSKGEVVGVAMSPRIIRNNELKSYIVLNIPYNDISEILKAQGEKWNTFLYTVAHECAHVEVSSIFNKYFPGVLLHKKNTHPKDINHDLINWVCWDEYSACRISYYYDNDSNLTKMYEDILVNCIKNIQFNIKKAITQYKKDKNGNYLFSKMYTEYGNLLKYSAYYLGHTEEQNISFEQSIQLNEVLKENNWFLSHFLKLKLILNELYLNYNNLTKIDDFSKISEIVEDMIVLDVVFIFSNNKIYIKLNT